MPDILEYAQQNNIKTIVHVHELEHMYGMLSVEQTKQLVSYPVLIIANSRISADAIKNLGRQYTLEVIYPAIDTNNIVYDKAIATAYRKKLGIAERGVFVWAMCGTLDENKNPDFFVEIAKLLRTQRHKLKMVWIGGPDANADEWRQRTKKEQLDDIIIWTGDVKKGFRKYFLVADGFVLTSKRESFSIVTAEALLMGLPVVANNCGGVSEILGAASDAIINEPNNAQQMVEKMKQHMENPGLRMSRAEKMKRFDAEKIGRQWNILLKKQINAMAPNAANLSRGATT